MKCLVYSKAAAYYDVCVIFATKGKWAVDLGNNDWWVHELVPKWTTP